MQNFLPCKTPTRGGHLDPNGLPRSGQLAATYEDPDAHMGHSPLVLGHPQFQHRNHHNLEVSVTRQRPVPLFTPTPPLLMPHTSLCPGVSGFELPGSPLSSEFAHCYDTTAPFQLSCMNPGIKEGCDVWICVSNSQWRRMGRNPVLYLFKLNYAERMVEVERVCQNIEMQTVTTCWQDNYHRAQEAAVRGTIPTW